MTLPSVIDVADLCLCALFCAGAVHDRALPFNFYYRFPKWNLEREQTALSLHTVTMTESGVVKSSLSPLPCNDDVVDRTESMAQPRNPDKKFKRRRLLRLNCDYMAAE